MADTIYILDALVTGSATVMITDDGIGSDTIRLEGLYSEVSTFTLAYSTDAGLPISASGTYYTPFDGGFTSHTLVITGVIENVTGGDGRDFIQGNVLGNRLFGDKQASGPGLGDTLWGGGGNDTIHGGAGNDEILGDNDNDLLSGGEGIDTISGGGGVDTVEGGAGADVLSGGATAGDTLTYAASTAGVQIALVFGDATFGIGGDAEGDRITGFANITGSTHDDRLEDTVKGTVAFGQNDNVFSGGGGRDRLILGGGNDTGLGGNGDDTLVGEVGDDLLDGGNNDDNLRGSRGQDTLTGGGGGDRFIFVSTNDSTFAIAQRDTITDFSSAEGDHIDLALIDAETGVAGNQAFHLVTQFTGDKGELRVKLDGADVLVLADVNGDGAADFAIRVLGVTGLTATDFTL